MKTEAKRSKKRISKGGMKIPFKSVIPPLALNSSPLFLAYRLTEEVSALGFDWPDLKGIFEKLDEEIKELREALSLKDRRRMRDEIGDLFFVLVNLSRFLGIDPEVALRKTVKKFVRRFHYIETSLCRKGKSLDRSSLLEMDRLWEEAKKKKK